MERGGALAAGMSLRLEITLLAACPRGQRPESESVAACLLSLWREALLLTLRLLRTQIGHRRIWSAWKRSGLPPWEALALSGPGEAL